MGLQEGPRVHHGALNSFNRRSSGDNYPRLMMMHEADEPYPGDNFSR